MAIRALVAILLLALITAFAGMAAGWRSWTFVVVEVVAIASLLAGDRWLTRQLDWREQGNAGEIKVAAVLEAASGDGWRTLHDVSCGRGNIDHVVVGPGGILTIETKSRKGRLEADQLDPAWLRQAYAERKLVERITGQSADALLVMSDAYLIPAVSWQRGVCVLPARMLVGHLAKRPQKLSPSEVESIYVRLAHAFAA